MINRNFSNNYHKKIKKDYQLKNLKNPFFHRQSTGKSGRLIKWLIISSPLILIFLIWFFSSAPLWRIQNIEISGLTRLSEGDLKRIIWEETAQKRWLFFQENNIFLFSDQNATTKIISDYNLAGVEIKKKWPGTLEVKVSERPYAFIFQEGSNFYYSSADAYLITEPAVSEENKKKYFILENKNPDTLIGAKNKINISNNYLNFILGLNGSLSAYPELIVERFIIDQEFNTVKVKFLNGPLVYFNVKEAADSQLNLLLLVKKEKIKDNFDKTNYIDLRYGDRVFVNPDFK